MSLSFGDDSLAKDVGASTSLSSPALLSGVARDPSYYCHDVIVLVDKVLFKVPRAIFNSSEVFQDMFAMPPPDGEAVDGSSDDHPLRLEGHSATEFRRVLKVLLPLSLRHGAPEELTPEQWQSVLAFATKWQFEGVREAAIGKLDAAPLDPIDKLVLALRYDVKQWLVDTLNRIAQRDAPLCPADAERLLPVVGIDYVLKIAQVREGGGVMTSGNSGCYCNQHGRQMSMPCSNGGAGNRASTDYSSTIRVVFGLQ